MKVIYFGDFMGDTNEEADEIKKMLRVSSVKFDDDKFEVHETPQFLEKEDFDVLFFDWGGASMGNSLMDSFCRQIVKHATDHPSKIYIMNSMFTKQAMEDALRELQGKPANIFLEFEKALPYLNPESSECLFRTADYGLALKPSYETHTACGIQFDSHKITESWNYCPNCGRKIKFKQGK